MHGFFCYVINIIIIVGNKHDLVNLKKKPKIFSCKKMINSKN